MASAHAWQQKTAAKFWHAAVLKGVNACPPSLMANSYQELGGLKSRSEFLFVRHGMSAARPTLVIQARQNSRRNHSCISVGFTATKKIGNAVTRNRCKRRMRALARIALSEFGMLGYDYVFIARAGTATANWESLRTDAQKALLRLRQIAIKPKTQT